MITPEKLTEIGCKKFHWNPKIKGGFFEYYLPVYGEGMGIKDTRLSVSFGGFVTDVPFMVWIVAPYHRLALENVLTIEQFCQMYELLTGKNVAQTT